ncbi:MAG: Hsp70 family protein [Deltaproteobacteria bacterium]|nr:MAG: Hsp70 family protein [Deltaproteobacteria bacterium]
MSGSGGIVLGIDLGTTYSAVAHVNRFGKPEILANAEGQPTTPSVVYFYDQDGVVVGEEAIKMCVMEPENVVRFIKRSMGEDGFALEFFGHAYTPQEISALILRKLKEDAEALTGEEIHDAVITVPAYFNTSQRGATVEAGSIAGLNVLSVINEPTAAAIAYGIDKLGGERTLLVFDLGGGTFDVTVMKVEGHKLRTLASDGNAELGGKDWDDRLVNHVAEQFVESHGSDPRDEPSPFQELYERCLAAKITLSAKEQAMIPVNYKGRRAGVRVSRDEFEDMTRDLVQQCIETTQLVLEKAGLDQSEVSDLLLVGGATRMPMIREALERAFGRPPIADLNPDECVALGASLAGVIRYRPDHPAFSQADEPPPPAPVDRRTPSPSPAPRRAPNPSASAAAIGLADGGSFAVRSGPPSIPPTTEVAPEPGSDPDHPVFALPGDVQIEDATTHPLGIIVLDRNRQERVVELIPEGTPLPHEFHGRFTYAYENMRAVRVEVTEGHGTYRDEVSVMAKVELRGLPPRPKGTPIDVIYRYSVDQILSVQVIDVETGQSREVKLHFAGTLGDTESGAPPVGGGASGSLRAAKDRNRNIRVRG